MSRKIPALFLSLLLLNGFALAVTGGDVKTIQDFTSVVGTFSGTVGAEIPPKLQAAKFSR